MFILKKVISLLVAVALLAGMSAFAMTNASAATTWAMPLDVTDENWHAETWDPAYAWNGPAAEVADTIISESTADGISFKFPEGGKADMTYPNVRYENAGGILQVTEDDYVNIKASCGVQDQKDVRWSLTLNFSNNSVNMTSAMVKQGLKTINDEGQQLLGGDVEMSIKISEAAKEVFEADPSKGAYDAIWGPGGNAWLTGVVFYLFSNNRNNEITLVVKALTIGDEGDFEEPGAAPASTAAPSEAASTADASSSAESTAAAASSSVSSSAWGAGANTSKTAPAKGNDDGLSAGAIAGIIIGAVVVLAAIAVVVVIVVKKGKGGDAKPDAQPEAKDESAETKEDK